MMSPAWRISSGGSPASKHSRRAWKGWKPDERVEVQPRQPLGRRRSDLLDVDAARRRQHESGRFAPRSKVIEK